MAILEVELSRNETNWVPHLFGDNRGSRLKCPLGLIRTARLLEVRSHKRSLLFQPRRYIRNYDIFLGN